MKKTLLTFLTVTILLSICYSCSTKDTNPPEKEEVGTCDDGILNGNELIIDCGGNCPGFCPESSLGVLRGELVTILTLDRSIEYQLKGPYIVRDKAQLTIPEGTVIKADPGSYIAVAQGGKLNVFGQPYDPVIITSSSVNPAPGDWGGIVICGQAPIQSGGVDRSEIADIFYGGSDVDDSSGVLRNLRIEYAGETGYNTKKFDGLAFYGVGSITTITQVEIFESNGNGIKFVGGNAIAEKLFITNTGKSSIEIKNNWSGTGSDWYLKNATMSGLAITSDDEMAVVGTIFIGNISDVSISGSSYQNSVSYSGGSGVYNLSDIYTSKMITGIQTTGTAANAEIDLGYLRIDGIQFDNPASNFNATNYNGINSSFFTENENNGAGNKALKPEWAEGWTIGFN
jgi:hypothetical protein